LKSVIAASKAIKIFYILYYFENVYKMCWKVENRRQN